MVGRNQRVMIDHLPRRVNDLRDRSLSLFDCNLPEISWPELEVMFCLVGRLINTSTSKDANNEMKKGLPKDSKRKRRFAFVWFESRWEVDSVPPLCCIGESPLYFHNERRNSFWHWFSAPSIVAKRWPPRKAVKSSLNF